ncbi:MAG: hypothetical protein HYZ13_16125 [Acidobacteria bacterium]|nr:hypothetical protein [Acidobacteriota bacterium]
MRPALILVLPALVASMACRRPEVDAFRQSPHPVVVKFNVPEEVPDREAVAKEYAAVLRQRLATRLVVVPEGVEPPNDAAQLTVVIASMQPGSSEPTPGQVGVATGITVGVISGAMGSRHPVWNGFWWGMFAGHHAAHAKRYEDRLGFRPIRMEARVFLTQPGLRSPVVEIDLDSREIVEAMDPIRRSDEDDPAVIREAEARGLARVVIRALDDQLELKPREARWFGDARPNDRDEERPAAKPEPKPEPEPKAEGERKPETEEPKFL